MQLKTSAFQLSIVWITASLLTACGPSVTCDNPLTAGTEYCGSIVENPQSTTSNSTHRGGGGIIYYRSTTSSYYMSNPARTSSLRSSGRSGGSRSGFGSTGSGRSGFG